MGLPVSRDITANPADPGSSVVFNKIQDCIVGVKHPELERGIIGNDWCLKAGTITQGAGQVTLTAINTTLIANLGWMPLGDRITTINWSYNPNGNVAGCTLSLRRRKLDGTAEETLQTVTDVTGTSGIKQNVQTYNITTVAGYAYYVQFDGPTSGTANEVLLSANVKHDRL